MSTASVATAPIFNSATRSYRFAAAAASNASAAGYDPSTRSRRELAKAMPASANTEKLPPFNSATRGSQYGAAGAAAGPQPDSKLQAFNHGGHPSFSDLIDTINPLQHIPLVNTVYRYLTGDHEGAVADMAGGTLYGGPLGLVASMADLGVRAQTGKSIGDTMMASVFGDPGVAKPATAIASAAPATLAIGAPQFAAAAAATQAAPAVAAAAAVPVAAAAHAPTALLPSGESAPTPSVMAGPMPPAQTAQSMALAAKVAGPQHEGDYLVFGTPAAEAPASSPITVTPVAAQAAAPRPQFATYGAGQKPSPTLPATTGTVTTADKTALAGTRFFPAPPRNVQSAPPATLPPPTTGPGALPGGKSMALSAQGVQTQPGMQSPTSPFLSAYMQALDKYQKTQGLTGVQPVAAPATDAAAPAAAAADTTLH